MSYFEFRKLYRTELNLHSPQNIVNFLATLLFAKKRAGLVLQRENQPINSVK